MYASYYVLLYMRVCIYQYVCMHVSMHVRATSTSMHAFSMGACTYLSMYDWMIVCMCNYMYACMCVLIYVHVHLYKVLACTCGAACAAC